MASINSSGHAVLHGLDKHSSTLSDEEGSEDSQSLDSRPYKRRQQHSVDNSEEIKNSYS